MMLSIVEWTVRSTLLGLLVWIALSVMRIRDPRIERGAWRIVLASSLLMPALLELSAFSPIQAPALPVSYAELTLPTSNAVSFWNQAPLAIVGLIGLALVLRQSLGIVSWWLIRQRARPLSPAAFGDLDVRVSPEVSSPATVFSTVLVPADFGDWSEQAQRFAIEHERSHIASKDFYVQWLAQLHRNVFWFNPFCWWLAHRLALLSELVSDDAAANDDDARTTYAKVLLSLAQRAANDAQLVPMIRSHSLCTRIERVLSERRPVRLGATKILLISCILAPLVVVATTPLLPSYRNDAIAAADANVVLPKSNPAKPLSQPRYPSASNSAGEQGTVVLNLLVLEDGSVADAAIHRSSGYPDLDYAAFHESFRWRLDPGTVDGSPSRMWGRFAVTFKLKD